MTSWREWADWVGGWLRWDNTRLDALERKVADMADVLDTLKTDFEAYKGLVDTTLAGLQAKVTALTAGQLDPTKAQAIDDEINAARKALAPAP